MAKQQPSARTRSSPARRPRAVAAPPQAQEAGPAGIVPRIGAELLGTFFLVLAGCGSALFAAITTAGGAQVGIGYLGVALAFGAAVAVMAVAVGGVSGGHFNPAVSVGLAVAGRFPWRLVVPHVLAQLVGATLAGALLFAIASGRDGFDAVRNGFTSNGYGERSPDAYSLGSAVLIELVLTALFVGVILAVTASSASKAVAPVAVGLTLALANLIAIPIDNASINPARSLGVGWFAGPDALAQLWLFLLVPTAGGVLAGLVARATARPRLAAAHS